MSWLCLQLMNIYQINLLYESDHENRTFLVLIQDKYWNSLVKHRTLWMYRLSTTLGIIHRKYVIVTSDLYQIKKIISLKKGHN